MEAGVPTHRFWRLTFREVEREVTAINNERKFLAAQAANVANFAMAEDQATMNKFLGREKASDKGWAQKAYMYFDAMTRLDDEDVGA